MWRIGRDRAAVEIFRVQPLANEVVPGGVGRDVRGLPPGTITITDERAARPPNTLGSQHLVANGLAFGRDGTLSSPTPRAARSGALSRPPRAGAVARWAATRPSPPNTLCLDDIFVEHPYLEGADGIVLDDDGNIFVAANERNAVTVVTEKGRVIEYFRNAPVAAPAQRGPLEFPTSPVLVGRRLCLTSSDGARRDNSPTRPAKGAKVSCLS